MTVLQSSIGSFEIFTEHTEEELINAIKSSNKREIIIIKNNEGFFKLEGKRNTCNKSPVDVKILVKKNNVNDNKPKLSEEEKLLIFQEWYESNQRIPEPNEMHGLLDVDKYYRKYCKDKQFVDKVKEFVHE